MRRSIGLRATPNRIWISVIEAVEPGRLEQLVSTSLPVPEALRRSEQLRFVRQAVADTIAEYEAVVAGIRLVESVAKSISVPRLHLEGVIQELLASSTVKRHFYGPIATIARLLGEPRQVVKGYIDGLSFRDIEGWSQMKPEQRESILVAVAAQSLEPM